MSSLIIRDIVGGYWTNSPLSMLPIYKELIVACLQVWVFRSWLEMCVTSLTVMCLVLWMFLKKNLLTYHSQMVRGTLKCGNMKRDRNSLGP
ncbi:putative carboxypeptidase D [Helianthus annuus]|nr:putative carboxypeptidase D [Helianthus annuus]